MENLKKLMGSAYKEGITVEEINSFLGGGKFVNLNDGGYVDKDKYNKAVADKDKAETSLKELQESTKDYETLKKENETFKGEKADAELKTKLIALGISEKSFKYVKGDINDKTLTLGDDDKANKDAVAKYLKDNPQFAAKQQQVQSHVRVVSTKVDSTDGNKDVVDNKTINDNFRAALGKKINV
jgi:FtsZ-binding cell division protein ZapB